MPRPRVMITRRWPEAVEAEIATRYDVVFNTDDRALDADTLHDALRDFDAVCPTVTDTLDAAVFGQPPLRARLLANYGVGYSHIDVSAAARLGMLITNTPDVLTDCTADLALTLMLMVARRAGEGERLLRSGAWHGWCPTQLLGARLSGRTLGIVGFGRIGRAVAARAHAGFGMRILVHGRARPDAAALGVVAAHYCESLDELLAQVDVLSLHCPGGAANRHLIGAAELARLKPGAIVINTARGEVIDGAALEQALTRGSLAGAGLDVYEHEPQVPDAWRKRDDMVLLPHLGSATRETREAMGRRVLANLDAFFAGRAVPDAVAF